MNIKFTDSNGIELKEGDNVIFEFGTKLINHTGELEYKWIKGKNPVFKITCKDNRGACATKSTDSGNEYDFPLTIWNHDMCSIINN